MRGGELGGAECALAGLEDFGDDSFRDGLDQLVSSIEGEAQLNEIGGGALESPITTNLLNRLPVTAWAADHPQIRDERVERPVFVLGLPRTGTTLLSYLLAQDPAARSLMRWEAMSSVP